MEKAFANMMDTLQKLVKLQEAIDASITGILQSGREDTSVRLNELVHTSCSDIPDVRPMNP